MSFYSSLGICLVEHPITGLHPRFHELPNLPTHPQLTCMSDNSCILSGGLVSGKISSQILKFSHDKLEHIGNMYHPKLYHSQVIIENILYTLGGSSDSSNTTSIFESYDLSTHTPILLSPIPDARKKHTASVSNLKIFLIGGISGTSTSKHTIFYYSILTSTWSNLTLSHSFYSSHKSSLNLSIRNFTSIPIDNRSIVIFGGYSEGGNYNYNSYTLDTHKLQMLKMKFVWNYNVFTGGFLLRDDVVFIGDSQGGRHVIHIQLLIKELKWEYGREKWIRRRNMIWVYYACKVEKRRGELDRLPLGVFQNAVEYL